MVDRCTNRVAPIDGNHGFRGSDNIFSHIVGSKSTKTGKDPDNKKAPPSGNGGEPLMKTTASRGDDSIVRGFSSSCISKVPPSLLAGWSVAVLSIICFIQ